MVDYLREVTSKSRASIANMDRLSICFLCLYVCLEKKKVSARRLKKKKKRAENGGHSYILNI